MSLISNHLQNCETSQKGFGSLQVSNENFTLQNPNK